jgi:hypothetical protein
MRKEGGPTSALPVYGVPGQVVRMAHRCKQSGARGVNLPPTKTFRRVPRRTRDLIRPSASFG